MNRSKLIFASSLIVLFSIGLMACSDEDGTGPQIPPTSFKVTVTNVSSVKPAIASGTFSSPGKGNLGPDVPALFPGESASFTFSSGTTIATPLGGSGEHLNLTTMFVQSNDWFYAFPPEGIDLYDSQRNAIGTNGPADVTDQLVLYDAGTETDTAPGTGPDQKPAQDPKATNVGPAQNGVVQPVSQAASDANFNVPAKSDVINVTIENTGDTEFKVTITNVSKPGTINSQRAGGSVPLSPGAWAVYDNAFQANGGPFQFFQVGQPASKGIELIAEDGFPADKVNDGQIDLPPDMGLADGLAKATGLTNPLSPPVITSYKSGFKGVFDVGAKAGEGVETVAEDGFPASMKPSGDNLPPQPNEALVDILKGKNAVRSVGAAPNPGGNVLALEPAKPGQNEGESGSFTVKASPGDRLNFVTMYVQSNDFFYAFGPDGIPLFDGNQPVSGNVTDQVVLYDAGTEVDEKPGVGLNQKARQGFTNLDVGQDENGVIQVVVPAGASGGNNDGFSYPASAKVIRVTITPQQ